MQKIQHIFNLCRRRFCKVCYTLQIELKDILGPVVLGNLKNRIQIGDDVHKFCPRRNLKFQNIIKSF